MMPHRVRGRRFYLWRGLRFSLLLVLIAAAYHMALVYLYSRPQPLAAADAALVLGAAAWDKRPSPVFRERINHAIHLYRSGVVGKLIFTGGTPKPGFMTEAEVGRRYAILQGVPASDIVYENRSRNTWQNLANAKQVAANNGLHRLIVVSDPYHMARAMAMARDLGLDAQAAPTPTSRFNRAHWPTRLKFWLQESYLLALYHGLSWRLPAIPALH